MKSYVNTTKAVKSRDGVGADKDAQTWKELSEHIQLHLPEEYSLSVFTTVFSCSRNRKEKPEIKVATLSAENTWEPEDNLDCPELIEEFLRNVAVSGETERDDSHSLEPVFQPKEELTELEADIAHQQQCQSEQIEGKIGKPGDHDTATGDDRSAFPEPERIIGSTDRHGELMFLIKWKDTDDVALLSAREASARWPQMVIGFYEDKLTWHGEEEQ
ncbi:chromobox protein homolog 3b isoform X1 [Hoplias malabaricus]|uniref:chromobox protein homolog 3b isoform X1 n=1 Tax=Hoplias malabaricus TaxID=27720 RepID=UPI00346250B0